MSEVRRWQDDVLAAALLGTDRRPPPAPPAALGVVARPDADPATALLDAAALVAALVRPRHGSGAADAPAPADAGSEPPPAATQLLQLLLDQPPVSRTLVPLALDRWLAAAVAAGRRVPHHALPDLLQAATREPALRAATRAVADRRGAWLAARNPAWAWLDGPPPGAPMPDPADWLALPLPEREAIAVDVRGRDAAAGRRLVEVAWSTDAAPARARLVATLGVGLGADDEPFLESALDDRSAAVREEVQRLLERLPGSARAQRMGERLRPLLSVSGRLRRTVALALPEDPDRSGVRDGLGPPPAGRSRRGHWLELIVAGAPLSVWTDATGEPPDRLWAQVTDADARRGLLRAVAAQHDVDWARAVVADAPALLRLLPPAEREAAARRVVDAPIDRISAGLLRQLPTPWSDDLAAAVLARLAERRSGDTDLLPVLATGLPASALPLVQRWDATDHHWGHLPRDLSRFLSLTAAIPEAFR